MRARLRFRRSDGETRWSDAYDEREEISWDYAGPHHSTRAHPLASYRAELHAMNLLGARDVQSIENCQRVSCAGVVICRQRPGTASGVTFMTLEDEMGFINVVVWIQVFEQFAVIARAENFLAVSGRVQRQDGVVHVVAEKLWSPRVGVNPVNVGSRDFH